MGCDFCVFCVHFPEVKLGPDTRRCLDLQIQRRVISAKFQFVPRFLNSVQEIKLHVQELTFNVCRGCACLCFIPAQSFPSTMTSGSILPNCPVGKCPITRFCPVLEFVPSSLT